MDLAARLPRVAHDLIPPPTRLAEGVTVIDSAIDRGLPHAMPLGGSLVLGLVAPTGLARFWTEADPGRVVSDSAAPAMDLPLRLVLREGLRLVAVAPLVLGPPRLVGQAGGAAAPRILLQVLSWRIHAGALQGTNATGSRLTLGWAPYGAEPGPFTPPRARDAVIGRLAGERAEGLPPDPDLGHAAGPSATAQPGRGSGRYVGYSRRFGLG